jgi:hypothetical protein
MYNTGGERPPKRPAVVSQASAMAELRAWLAENRYHTLVDGDGLTWQLTVEVAPAARPRLPRGVEQDVHIGLTARAGAAELVRTGSLDPVADERLIAMLGDEEVELAMRPRVATVSDAAAARPHLATQLPQLRAELAAQSLHATKRRLVFRWLDGRQRFGAVREP